MFQERRRSFSSSVSYTQSMTALINWIYHHGEDEVHSGASGANSVLATVARELDIVMLELTELEKLEFLPAMGGLASAQLINTGDVKFTDSAGMDQTSVISAALENYLGSERIFDPKTYRHWEQSSKKMASSLKRVCTAFELCLRNDDMLQKNRFLQLADRFSWFDVALWESMERADALASDHREKELPLSSSFAHPIDYSIFRVEERQKIIEQRIANGGIIPCINLSAENAAPTTTTLSRFSTATPNMDASLNTQHKPVCAGEVSSSSEAEALYAEIITTLSTSPSKRDNSPTTHLISRLFSAIRYMGIESRTQLLRLIHLLLNYAVNLQPSDSCPSLLSYFLTYFNSTIAVIIDYLQAPETSVCSCFFLSTLITLHHNVSNAICESPKFSSTRLTDFNVLTPIQSLLHQIMFVYPTAYYLVTAVSFTALECRYVALSTLKLLLFNTGAFSLDLLLHNSCHFLTYYDNVLLKTNPHHPSDAILYHQALRFLFDILVERRFVK